MEKNLANNAIVWGSVGAELTTVFFELRYGVMLAFILIFADFWWGYSEAKVRYAEAVKENNHVLMEKYKWHKSRAIRRTSNKVIDYLTYILVGAFIGLAITEPLDICGHTTSAAIGLLIGCVCEIASLLGHIFYVKLGIEVTVSDAVKWLVRFIVKLLKKKSQDIGEAVEETMEGYDKEQNLEN